MRDRPPAAPADDGWLAAFAGLSLPAVLALAEREGRAVRVLRPGDAMTMDWRPGRLNVHLDEHGDVAGLRAG